MTSALKHDINRSAVGPWALNTVYNVDCLVGLTQISSDTIDVIVTSPPYWGQRGGLGLGTEEDPRNYIRHLVAILAETMRCLKPSGTIWLNIGDAYNTPINWREDDYVYSSLGPDGKGLPQTSSAYIKPRGRRRAFIGSTEGGIGPAIGAITVVEIAMLFDVRAFVTGCGWAA